MDFRIGLDKLKPIPIAGESFSVKLDANESAFDLPLIVRKKIIKALEDTSFNRYTNAGQIEIELKKKIAKDFDVTFDNIAIGNGSSQLLQAACYIFGGSGRKVVFPKPSYSMYVVFCKLSDSQTITVDLEKDFSLSPDKIISIAKQEKASLIMISNPHNPTGNEISLNLIQKIIENVDCPVIVDEAYIRFGAESAKTLLNKYSNLIIMRTFSKTYGLSAIRVGYAVASKEIIKEIEKFLLPYHMSVISLIAANIVYENKEEFNNLISDTIAERERVRAKLMSMSEIQVFPSATNFLLIKAQKAIELVDNLVANGIYVQGYNLPNFNGYIRITIGTPDENNALLEGVQKFYSNI